MTTEWAKLAKEFRELCLTAGGFSKSTSGTLSISFDNEGMISLEFGAYDIGDMPRHYFVGELKSEEEALQRCAQEIEKMKNIVKLQLADDET